VAEEIRERIFNEVGLTASAGISINFVAKIASDYNKTNGQKTVNQMKLFLFWRSYLFVNFMAW
jgi:DNA polymerase-4